MYVNERNKCVSKAQGAQLKLCATPSLVFKGNITVAHCMPLSSRLYDAECVLSAIAKFLVYLTGESGGMKLGGGVGEERVEGKGKI